MREFDLRLWNNDMVLCKETLNVLNEAPVIYVNVIIFIVRSRYMYMYYLFMTVILLDNEGWINHSKNRQHMGGDMD